MHIVNNTYFCKKKTAIGGGGGGGIWVKNCVFKYVKLQHITNTLLFTELKICICCEMAVSQSSELFHVI